MAKVLVPIADGTEEIEAVTIIDILVRAQIDVVVASCMPELQIKASRGVNLVADISIEQVDGQTLDLIALPGGIPGANHLNKNPHLTALLKQHDADAKWIAAICAAPQVVLYSQGLLDGARATCHPAFQDRLPGCERQQRVVIDSTARRITSQGPGTSLEFALSLVSHLVNQKTADEIAQAACAHWH